MARIFTDGGETGDFTRLSVVSGDVAIATDYKRTGSYSYKLASWLYGNASIYKYISPASDELYMRFGLYGYDKWWEGWHCGFVLGADVVKIYYAPYYFRAYVGATLVGTSNLQISAYTWYVIEMHLKVDGSNGIFEFKIDGIPQVKYLGDTQPGASTTINSIYFSNTTAPGGATATRLHIDDIAINDTTGSVDNSWCGDGHVIIKKPVADGDVIQLVPSSGSSHWALVDDIPPSGTDYVSGSVVGKYDLYTPAAFTTEQQTIKNVSVICVSSDNIADGGYISLGIKTSGSESWSGSMVQTTGYRTYSESYPINPISGSAWTKDDLNAIQIGVKVEGVS